MTITFTNKYTMNGNGGINFQVQVDKQLIVCVVSTEALQDINPNFKTDSVVQQYQDNQNNLENIVKNKIKNGEIINDKLFIHSIDVR